jgi:branched-chain amino acid transport system substrate-binding protein
MRSTRAALAIASLVALLAVLADAQAPILIGRTRSTYGSFAVDSAIITEGFDFWLEDVNARGGILMSGFDGLRHPVQVITYEDASTNQIVDLQYKELINARKVHALFGPFGGSLTTTAVRTANATQTPIVYAAGSTDALFNSGYRHSFSTQAPFGLRARACISLFNTSTDLRTMTVLGGDDAFQASATRDFTNEAARAGIQRVAGIVFPAANTTNYDAAIELLRTNESARGELLFVAANPGIAIDFVEKLRNVYDPKLIFVSNGAALAQLNAAFGWQAEFITDSTQWISTLNYTDEYYGSPSEFREQFENRTGHELELFHASGYISGYILEKGFERTASFNNTDIIAAIRSLDVESLWGRISFGPQGYILADPICEQIQRNVLATVAPQSLATARLVYPGTPNRPPPPPLSRSGRNALISTFSVVVGLAVIGAVAFGIYRFKEGYIFVPAPKVKGTGEW